MVYLTAAVVLVGVLCLLDLVLTVGVIRRLREHTRLLSQTDTDSGLPADIGIPVGETVGEFAATTVDGEPVSRESLRDRTLVGFFSPGCQPCAEQLPRFIEYASSLPVGRALAVVSSEVAEGAGYARRLTPVARVVREQPIGPVHSAFQVAAFPTIYLIDDGGVVAAVGTSVDVLGGAAAAAVVPV